MKDINSNSEMYVPGHAQVSGDYLGPWYKCVNEGGGTWSIFHPTGRCMGRELNFLHASILAIRDAGNPVPRWMEQRLAKWSKLPGI